MDTTATVGKKPSAINLGLPIGLLLSLSLLLAWTSPARVRVTLVDASSGKPVPGVLRVIAPDQSKALPLKGLLPRGQGLEETKDPNGSLYPILDWYALPSATEIPLPRKQIILEAFSGLESELSRVDLDLRESLPETVVVPIKFFSQLSQDRWFGGNTHLHLKDLNTAGTRRYLSEIPYVDRLDLLFISYLERAIWPSKAREDSRDDTRYSTNSYPTGELGRVRKRGPLLSNGEEHRNNLPEGTGFGHVMLLGIRELIRPVSIGPQIEGGGSDGTPLQKGILEARKQGGTTIWCHNQYGWEDVPNFVAGNLDGLNLFDGGDDRYSYDNWYQFLNSGLQVPVSTGTDWFMYDLARVYVRVEPPLSVKSWLGALASGHTFITNGPVLEFQVHGKGVGQVVPLHKPGRVRVTGAAKGRRPFGKLELVQNGKVTHQIEATPEEGHFRASLELELQVDVPSWLALRTAGLGTSYYGWPLFSHTSATYISIEGKLPRSSEARNALISEMKEALADIQRKAVFFSAEERERVLGVYQRGIEALRRSTAG